LLDPQEEYKERRCMAKGNLRNKPCPCGSGKKFKDCCRGKMPRITSITTDMGKPMVVNGVRMSADGTVELLNKGLPLIPEKAYHNINYNRKKSPKILNKISLDPNQLLIGPHLALKKFDLIFAIDTNTKVVNGEVISISCIVLCKLTYGKKNAIIAEYAPVHCLEFRNIRQDAENIAWMKSIQLIIANPSYNPKLKIGLIVDSDLGNISAYNNRSVPIYADFYLPQNIELIYASADVGKEFVVNKLISLCDKEAKMLLEDISLNKISSENLQEVNNEPYTHFRFWNKH
jgi:hypothetical protein